MKKAFVRYQKKSIIIALNIIIILALIVMLFLFQYIQKSHIRTDIPNAQKYINNYKAGIEKLYDRIKKVKKEHAKEFMADVKQEIDDSINAGKVANKTALTDLYKDIEKFNADDKGWQIDNYTNGNWTVYYVIKGFSLYTINANITKDFDRLYAEETEAVIAPRFYGEGLDDAVLKNEIVKRNVMRYVYSFFDHLIDKQELDSIMKEVMDKKDLNFKLEKHIKNVKYTFEYDYISDDFRIHFKRLL